MLFKKFRSKARKQDELDKAIQEVKDKSNIIDLTDVFNFAEKIHNLNCSIWEYKKEQEQDISISFTYEYKNPCSKVKQEEEKIEEELKEEKQEEIKKDNVIELSRYIK